jgi:hypothetical protein
MKNRGCYKKGARLLLKVNDSRAGFIHLGGRQNRAVKRPGAGFIHTGGHDLFIL